jgi:hypothetical protein
MRIGNMLRRRTVWLPVATIAVCGMLLAATYQRGIERRLEGAITIWADGWEYAAAISDHAHHLNLGYVAYSRVYTEFEKVFFDLNLSPEEFRSRGRDKNLINEVFQKAARLTDLTIGAIDQQTIFPMYYSDLGFIDYAKIGFSLFGLNIEALYKLHFVFLAVSTLCFILTFRNSYLASALIIGITLAYFCEISSTLYGPYVPAVFGMHQSSYLALIPAFYLTLLLLWRTRLSLLTGICAGISILILILAIEIRGSAQWALIAVTVVAACQAVAVVWASWRRESDRRIVAFDAVASVFRWPIVLIIVLVVGHQFWFQSRLHAVYDSDDVTPQHALWWSMHLNAAYWDPDAQAIAGRTTGPVDDSASLEAVVNYATQIHLISNRTSLGSLLTHSPWRWHLVDRLLKRWFIEHYSRHPERLLYQFLIVKPAVVVRAIWYNNPWVFPLWTKLAGFTGGVAFLLLLFTTRVPIEEAARLFACLSVVALSSAVPLLIGAPGPSYMLETEVTWPLWAFLGVPLVIYCGWTVGRRHFVPGGLFGTEIPRMQPLKFSYVPWTKVPAIAAMLKMIHGGISRQHARKI